MTQNYKSKNYPFSENQLEKFKNYLELEEKSTATVQKYMHDVTMFFLYQEYKGIVCKQDVIEYKKWLIQRYEVRSVNSMITALNRFLSFLGADECCVKLQKVQQATFCDKQKELTREEYLKLLKTAKEQNKIRLYLILQTICATGIRVSELQYITVQASVDGIAVVRNKGKIRIILIPQELCNSLLAYAHEKNIQGGSIFLTRGGKPVDRSNIWTAMKRLCEQSGVESSKVFPHNLRRLFARTFYKKEKDITRLADILGHKNVNTTRVYVISSGAEHRAQIEDLHLTIPYSKTIMENSKQHNNMLCCSSKKRFFIQYGKT